MEVIARDEWSLWTTENRLRWFLLPLSVTPRLGPLSIRNVEGTKTDVDPDWVDPFEVTEAEALRWAREELGDSLTELKQNIEAKLDDWRRQLDDFNNAPLTQKTKVTPEAGSVFYELLTALPQVFRESTSGDDARVATARQKMNDFERRFTESGLDVQGRAAVFPERLAKTAAKSSKV